MIGPELLAALAAAPDLPDAACAGRWELFDPPEPSEDEDDTDYRQTAALRVCNSCPALGDC
ncbi:hypothetical protein [Mycolicibacterium gilvum]|uniref:hypothetical protein n=1 Tax=Mycolicibacterium gilvum TaxID=1804 RepID=UPI0040453072